MRELIAQIFTPEVIQAIALVISTVVLAGLGHLASIVKAKLESDRSNAIVDRVANAARVAVLATHQQFVANVKDGKLSNTTANRALDMALDIMRVELGKAGIAELRAVLGGDDALVNSFLTRHVEAALLSEKTEGALRPPLASGTILETKDPS